MKIAIGVFQHKTTKEFGFMVSAINNAQYVYNAKDWDLMVEKIVEGTERVDEVLLAQKREVVQDLDKIVDQLVNNDVANSRYPSMTIGMIRNLQNKLIANVATNDRVVRYEN